MRVEGVLVSGSDVPGEYSLPLVLRQLVVVVRNLYPVARGEEVEVKDIDWVRLKIEPVEDRLVVALVMKWRELGRIKESSTACTIERQKITHLLVAETPRCVTADGTETSVVTLHAAE